MEELSITQRFAAYAVEHVLSPEDYVTYLPYFKAMLLDWMATIAVSREEECCKLVQTLVDQRGSTGGSAALLAKKRLASPDAALLNTVAGHAIDYDDVHETDGLHLNSPILSTAFAVADETGATLGDVFEATVVGMDVTNAVCRLLTRGHTRRNWHTTATMSVFGAATAAGRLLGLNELQMRCAFGIAASCSAGLLANLGTMTKPLQVGFAAQRGVEAALLAGSGFTAHKNIFDSEYPEMVSDQISRAEGLAFLENGGGAIAHLALKRFPCGVPTHANIMNMLKLRQEHGIDQDEIDRIDVAISPFTMASGCGPLMSRLRLDYGAQGKFSVPFVVAAAAKFGRVDSRTFTDGNAHDPEIVKLMSRVKVSVDQALTSTDAHMTVYLKNGQSWYTVTKNVRTGETLEDKKTIAAGKFKAEHGHLWTEAEALRLRDTVAKIPLEDRAGTFTDLLIGQTSLSQ